MNRKTRSLSKIAMHHVGGRWGNRPFPTLPHFEADFVVVLYEADTDAIAGIREACADQPAELIVLPFCLAAADSEAELQVYVNPGLTSLRRLGTSLRSRYLHLFGVDFDFGEAGTGLLERRNVKTHALDNVLAAQAPDCPAPDFLSLDVQGSEYEVLLGAEKALRDAVCGLIVEVEFAEMYVGQKRFQDICDLLAERGFDFVRFVSIGEASGPAAPLGFRLGGYQSWADALFLRRPDTLARHPEAADKFGKLCFMAIVFGNIELAIDCVERLQGVAPSPAPAPASPLAYQALVDSLGQLYARAEKVWSPVFSQILPAHRSFDYARAPGTEQWPEIFEGLRAFDDAYRRCLEMLQRTEDSEFEALLRRYGLSEQADRVNYTRRHQANGIFQAIKAARQA